MTTVTKDGIGAGQFGGVPYGNKSALKFSFETNASGVLVDSDQATAVGIGDIVRLGVLPGGFDLHDALAIIADAFTATITFDIGFAYVDGVDSTAVPQDADYFFASLASTAGRTRANNTAVRPVVLPKDAYLILTNKVAANASVGKLDVIIEGELKGAS
jgi:hypothetical protein